MGACTFRDIQIVKGDVREAYRAANKEARDYNGHQEGYSGDIQTTWGFNLLTEKAPRFGTKAFNAWEGEVIDDEKYGVEKWGLAGAVEIKGAKLKELKERRGLKGRKGLRAFYFFGWGAE
jgi:hypothetical protein